MKSIVKTAITKLSKRQYDEFLAYYQNELKSQIISSVATARYNWLRLVCIELSKSYGWSDEDLHGFIVNFCRQSMFLNRETCNGQDYDKGQEYLANQMKEIFGDRGFPDDYYASKFGKIKEKQENGQQ